MLYLPPSVGLEKGVLPAKGDCPVNTPSMPLAW